MAENQLNRQLAAGIRAAQQGDRERARELLEGVLRRDRNNEQGWIWLASVVDSQRERRLSLERVLKINPNNQAAQQALNSMVGVLGGGEESAAVDYAAISAAARTPIPSGRRGGGTGDTPAARTAAQARGGSGPNYVPLLIVAALVLGLLLLGSIFLPSLLGTTSTPTSVAVAEETEELATVDPLFTPPSPTIRPSATFDPDALEGVESGVTALPTFTPTATLPPTETPTETATIPPVSAFNFLVRGIQGSASPSLYLLQGDGTGLENVLNNVEDFDYNPETGLLVFTRRIFVEQPTPEILPTNTPVQATATRQPGSVPTESGGGGIVVRPGAGAIPDLLQFQMFVAFLDDTDNLTEVTSSALPSAYAPSISPDGSLIAFVSDVDGDAEIYLYNVRTRLSTQLTNNALAADTSPDWSPDGTQLVFSSDRLSPGSFDIFTLNPLVGADAESTVEQVTDSRGSNIEPQWSPSGEMITFLNINGESTTVRIASLDGSLTRDITFSPDWVYSNPTWSNDGNYVFYTSASAADQILEIRIYSPLTRDVSTFRIPNLNALQVIPR